MCGITGFLDPAAKETPEALRSVALRMARTLVHRGPDEEGAWVDAESGVALAHRRLSIVDLSPAGSQPMVSRSGRYVLVFNGEIYNAPALAEELRGSGAEYRGHSDTEVMLAAFEAWGIEGALRRFVGMFAFGLWDRSERRLVLARDRMGEKPLYYGWTNGVLLFGSELKALRQHPRFCADLDREAIVAFLTYGYIPAPLCIYSAIRKLRPGCWLEIDGNGQSRLQTYWSLDQTVSQGVAYPYRGSAQEAVEDLDRLLRVAVKGQMISDVPLGAFLSGGIDSSTVVALMQAQSATAVKTFSIGFEDPVFDEAGYAIAVARHLGTDHTQLYVTAKQMLDVIPLLPEMYDEPFGDSSQVPTYLVAKLAREKVTVALSGDGGDELFCGYERYTFIQDLAAGVARVPKPLRSLAASLLSSDFVGALADRFGRVMVNREATRRFGRPGLPSQKLRRLGGLLRARDREDIFWLLNARAEAWRSVLGAEPAQAPEFSAPRSGNLMQYMMQTDAAVYLPDDILVKVDRAGMAVSLESRIPLLDHRVVEFSCALPMIYKLREGKRKWVLRQVLARYVPAELVERKKRGFGVPVAAWLRGDLKDWADSLLSERQLAVHGIFDAGRVRGLWAEHGGGSSDASATLWPILMLQAWLEASLDDVAAAGHRPAAISRGGMTGHGG